MTIPGQLNKFLYQQLKKITVRRNGYQPCRVTLTEGRILDCVYICSNTWLSTQAFSKWSDDRFYNCEQSSYHADEIDINQVIDISESPAAIPARYMDKLYLEQPERGLSFTLTFKGGVKWPIVAISNTFADFIEYPPGLTAADIRGISDNEGYGLEIVAQINSKIRHSCLPYTIIRYFSIEA